MRARFSSVFLFAKARSFKVTTACTMLAMTLGIAPALAQDEGSMQVGNATVSVGAGTAILTLPDVPSFIVKKGGGPVFPFVSSDNLSEDFGEEIGWNVNGSIEVPSGANQTVSLNGFWANINDEDTTACVADLSATTLCSMNKLVDDDPTQLDGILNSLIGIDTVAKREVDHWGGSLEVKQQLSPSVSGVTQAPHRRYLALGADIRGIDQDIDVAITRTGSSVGTATYNEDLDTRYYGAYAAWGGDYTIPFLSRLTGGMGLQSSFQLRAGVYYADTDYEGRLIDNTAVVGNESVTSALSLSDNEVSFIGGLVLETRKRIGRRAVLSLKSEYEYYSYVPDMAYNQVDTRPGGQNGIGGQVGTALGSDDAFSAKTMLRLTIKLGPDSVFEEPLK